MRSPGQNVIRTCHRSISLDDLFDALPDDLADRSAFAGEIILIEPNDKAVRFHDAPRRLLVLRSGRASYSSLDGSGRVMFDKVPSNRLLGVIEALSGVRLDFEITAVTRCEFMVIGRTEFLELLKKSPPLCFRLAEILSRKNLETLRAIRARP